MSARMRVPPQNAWFHFWMILRISGGLEAYQLLFKATWEWVNASLALVFYIPTINRIIEFLFFFNRSICWVLLTLLPVSQTMFLCLTTTWNLMPNVFPSWYANPFYVLHQPANTIYYTRIPIHSQVTSASYAGTAPYLYANANSTHIGHQSQNLHHSRSFHTCHLGHHDGCVFCSCNFDLHPHKFLAR